MKCYKRIIPLILACMMLAGCGQNVYKKGVESLENKDYAAAQELHIMNRKNTKMRLLHLKMQFQPERRRQEQSVI